MSHRLHPIAVLFVALALGCASGGGPSGPPGNPGFDFFGAPNASDDDVDPWFPKVEEWQGRMQAEGKRLPASDRSLRGAEQSGKLLHAMGAYRDEQRVTLAKQVTSWSQKTARRYYKWDPASGDPTYDHWPTVGQLLANNGDDCDGLDLIAYQMLREFGFPKDRVFRAILRRNRDQANHMVTLLPKPLPTTMSGNPSSAVLTFATTTARGSIPAAIGASGVNVPEELPRKMDTPA